MAKDFYHDNFKRTLEKDGWLVTHDPYEIRLGRIGYEVDLGAEKLLAAEKEGEKIAVELKSFVGPSDVNEFHKAVGNSTITLPHLNYSNLSAFFLSA
jgi:hypothetical protein